jgi:Tol biopolymer transport system component
MKTTEQVTDWLKELKAERRDAVTKQMVFGNTGATNALTWMLATNPDADAVRLKINELQVNRNEAMTDELATVAYGAMIEALKWVLRDD